MPLPEPETIRTDAQLLTELTFLREKVEEGNKARPADKKDREIVYEPSVLTRAILEIVRQPLLILDASLCVQTANPSFYLAFHVSKEDTENRRIYDLANGQWGSAELHRLLEEIIPRAGRFDDFEIEHEFKPHGIRTLLFNGRRLQQGVGQPALILLAIQDITAQKAAATGPTANDA
jgi:PAS domain-containing protein